MRLVVFFFFLFSLAAPGVARAEEPAPDVGSAFAVGAATVFAGFAIGGTLAAASSGDAGKNEAGWLVMQSGFALAPFTSHAVVGEWGRGAVLAAIPTAAAASSVPIFAAKPDAVEKGTIETQRAMWGLFVAGLVTAAFGVVDVAFAPGRLRVAPVVGPGSASIFAGGAF